MCQSGFGGSRRLGLLFSGKVFRGDVAGTMQNANQLNAILDRAIENKVAADGKTAKVWSKFLDFAALVRRGGDGTQCGIKVINEPVGGGEITRRDVVSNFVVIEPRLARAKDSRHGAYQGVCCAARRLRPSAFTSPAVNSTNSPLSD